MKSIALVEERKNDKRYFAISGYMAKSGSGIEVSWYGISKNLNGDVGRHPRLPQGKNNGTLSCLMVNNNQIGFIPAKNLIRPGSPIIADEIILYGNTIYTGLVQITGQAVQKISSGSILYESYRRGIFAYLNIEGNCPSELNIEDLPDLKFSLNNLNMPNVHINSIGLTGVPMSAVGKTWKINTAVTICKNTEFYELPFDPLYDHFIPVSIPCRIAPPDASKLQRVISHVSPGVAVNITTGDAYLKNTSVFVYPSWIENLEIKSDPNNSSLRNQRVYVRFNNIKFFSSARCPGARDGYGNFAKWFILDKYYSINFDNLHNGIGKNFVGTPAYEGAGPSDSFRYEAGKSVEIWAYSYQDAKASGLFPNIDSMEENKCYLL